MTIVSYSITIFVAKKCYLVHLRQRDDDHFKAEKGLQRNIIDLRKKAAPNLHLRQLTLLQRI
jgi:hypothetical protein